MNASTGPRWPARLPIRSGIVGFAAVLGCAALVGASGPTSEPRGRKNGTHPRIELVSVMAVRDFIARADERQGPVAVILDHRIVRVSFDRLAKLPADVGVVVDQRTAPADGTRVIVAEWR